MATRQSLRDLTKCGLPHALDVMGERWSFMILRAAFAGIIHFEEFSCELGIARNILSNRLAKLVEHGVMLREQCEDDRRKVEYRLTAKGRDLLPAMLALRQWGEKYGVNIAPHLTLVDSRDRQPVERITVRAHDGRDLAWEDLDWAETAELSLDEAGS
ncbi:winged helix-turn-helix transcriptional regulator [Aurantiacibacter spongiae]|uniref:Transcriptional regulator n=1 Tax=Aurantiacibacter spongiae TaxID=2488860 RepID=A0A3N5DJD5_9SPHN|nr:helix-turn-helix domain-containing protein [Aurantiacibacter spongiae]RPF71812.1 transcriptional regulator [Aurantiacibacter spongiae]